MSTSLQTPTAEQLAWWQAQDARKQNENDYETTINILGLPSAAHEVDADAVRVTSADIGVLAAWLEEKGGTVTRLDTGFGVIVWTLATNAGADEGDVGCRVLVTVPVPVSGWVPCEIADVAVAA
ncbi:hypothetical protein [Streptomyces europaeiscabiei]|uniref:hypothetical protein n=1 Tax=Streptomyces europaeiscabiei TaxID=146819 RepID=UPI0029B05B44|nr:hypothetical protein [Streptomyces europaeiscabiei]MDX2766955.1 hypothetical protein [Streptomyces europaeiscabiei]